MPQYLSLQTSNSQPKISDDEWLRINEISWEKLPNDSKDMITSKPMTIEQVEAFKELLKRTGINTESIVITGNHREAYRLEIGIKALIELQKLSKSGEFKGPDQSLLVQR